METIRLEVPARQQYLHLLRDTVADVLAARTGGADTSPTAVHDVQLALHELCLNIVRHAYAGRRGGRIEVILQVEDRPPRLIIETRDTGEPFDLSQTPPPDLEQGQTGGYGLYLLQQLLTTVEYHPEAGNNRWRLIKDL